MNDDPSRSPGAPAADAAASPADPATETAVIRRAATVVVLRPSPAGREVYMLRRSAASPFMPSTLVFPGGRLDPDDGPVDDDRSWERAARRECQEEADLRLPDHPLYWFDTWLTPSAESRRRYLTRFFAVEIGAGEGDDAQADGIETHAGRWATVAAHLEAWASEQIDLPPPTLAVLLRLRDAGDEGLGSLLALDPRGTILPKVRPEGNQLIIVMPHDPLYASTPGEAAPAPARVHAFPSRFVRDGRRWRPA